MDVGCNAVIFRTLSLKEALDRIARAGYEWVEVEANLAWCSHADPFNDDPIMFKRTIAEFGFNGVSAIGSHRELITDPRAVSDIKRAISWSKEAGVTTVITGEGSKPESMSEPEALAVLRDRLTEILAQAEQAGVRLALETLGSISLTPGGLGKLLSLVRSPSLCVNFDTGNAHRRTYVGTDRTGYAWKLEPKVQDELALLEPVADRVKHVHIKDVIGRDAVALGQGEVDLNGCIKILDEVGYDRVLSVETEAQAGPEESDRIIRESRRYLEAALEREAT